MKNAPGSWIAVSLPVLLKRLLPADAELLGRRRRKHSDFAFEDF